MSDYYIGRYARNYNTYWHTFLENTHTQVLTVIDAAALSNVLERLGRRPRILDIACGTGLLLKKLLDYVPNLDIYGIDASIDMLSLAHSLLKDVPNVHLQQKVLSTAKLVDVHYTPHTFDLIICTNALHYLPNLATLLPILKQLLTQEGYIVMQDYVLPEPPFPWILLDWSLHWVKRYYMHEYTLIEAERCSRAAGFHCVSGKTFLIERVTRFFPTGIDRFWSGWVLQLSRPTF